MSAQQNKTEVEASPQQVIKAINISLGINLGYLNLQLAQRNAPKEFLEIASMLTNNLELLRHACIKLKLITEKEVYWYDRWTEKCKCTKDVDSIGKFCTEVMAGEKTFDDLAEAVKNFVPAEIKKPNIILPPGGLH